MKKSSVIILAVCAIAAVAVGIWGFNQRQQAQDQQQAQNQQQTDKTQQLDNYSTQLEDSFDELNDVQNNLLADMAQQRADGTPDQEIIVNAIDALSEPIHHIAEIEAPDAAATAQSHFTAAAESCDSMADQLRTIVSDPSLSTAEQQAQAIAMLPDAMSALNELQAGVEELNKSGVAIPESAQQLIDTLDSVSTGDFSNIVGS